MPKNPKFVVSSFMNELIKRIHKAYPHQEWSGIWRAEKKDWYYLISDIIFWEQENSWTLTTISEKWVSEILEKLVEKCPEKMGEYNVWIHSHHSMAVFWSGTDNAQKQSFDDGNAKHFFHIVTNYDKSWNPWYKWALTFYKPMNVELEVDVEVESGWDILDICWEAKGSILAMQEQAKIDKEKLWDELIEIVDWIKNQKDDTILSDDLVKEMINTINVSQEDAESYVAQFNQHVNKIKEEKIQAMYKMYNKKINKLDEPINELIEACLPFNQKIEELKSCVNKNKPANSYVWYNYNKWKWHKRQAWLWQDDDYDPLAWIDPRYVDRDDDSNIPRETTEVVDDISPIIEEIVRDNKVSYRYETYVYRDDNKRPIPQWFEIFHFDAEKKNLEMHWWNVPIEMVYDEILLQKWWSK